MAACARFLNHVQVPLATQISRTTKRRWYFGRNRPLLTQVNHDPSSQAEVDHNGGLGMEHDSPSPAHNPTSDGDDLSNMAYDLKIEKIKLAEKVFHHNFKESEGSLGSGVDGIKLCSNPCGNWSALDGYACNSAGSNSCPSCSLVKYCSLECKEENWDDHKLHCESNLMMGDWRPAFLSPPNEASLVTKESEFLWGNVPAYGILGQNVRATELPQNMHLCFAASGDIRNVIETVCQLPDQFTGQATIYINDHNPMVIARNFLMLKLLQTYGYESIDAVIALWYSAGVTSPQSIVVDGVMLDSIKKVANDDKIHQGKDGELRLDFGSSSGTTLTVDVGEELWLLLARMSASRWSMQSVWECRTEKINSERWKLDRKLACLRPSHRVVWKEFQKWGRLLPFGACNAHHNAPNKFLLDPTVGWIMSEDADPLSGWNITDVVATGSEYGVSSADLFGCLFFHLRERLTTFLCKLQTCRVHLRLSCKDASHMAKYLLDTNIKLHCVDTSNIADVNYGGIKPVLCTWGPLLDRGSGYKSTLITYFMNWAHLHTQRTADHATSSKLTWKDVEMVVATIAERSQSELKGLSELLAIGSRYGNISILNYFHNFDAAFSGYLNAVHADAAAAVVGLERRRKHCIVPHRFGVGLGASTETPGSNASYDQCYYDSMVSNLNFTERFVEWGTEGEG